MKNRLRLALAIWITFGLVCLIAEYARPLIQSGRIASVGHPPLAILGGVNGDPSIFELHINFLIFSFRRRLVINSFDFAQGHPTFSKNHHDLYQPIIGGL